MEWKGLVEIPLSPFQADDAPAANELARLDAP
jgi:hypothetical protein